MKAVADTNILVSAVIRPLGNPRRVYNAAIEGRFELVVSQHIIDEFKRVLGYARVARGLDVEPDDLIAGLMRTTEVVVPTDDHIEIRDPTDAAIVQTAIAAGADFIVTGDLDLLALGEYRGIAIVRAADFLARLDAAGA